MGNWSVTFFFILQTSSTTRVPIVKPARRAGLGMQKNRTLLPGFTLMPRHRLSVAERRSVQQRKCEGKGINACYTPFMKKEVCFQHLQLCLDDGSQSVIVYSIHASSLLGLLYFRVSSTKARGSMNTLEALCQTSKTFDCMHAKLARNTLFSNLGTLAAHLTRFVCANGW
jgi:hypothetical protein